MSRGLENCEESCIFYKPATTGMEKSEVLPLYKVLKSKSEGSHIIIVSRERTDGKLQFISLLIDVWKMGLKDGYGSHKITKQDFQKKVIAGLNRAGGYTEISLPEALWIIKYGLRIAKEVNTRIPREFEEFKYILGDMTAIKAEGSLYKCFKCGKGELSDDDVKFIKDVTRHDTAEGVCGTMAETMIYFVCDECKQA